ncbi:MAG: DNA-processing protein DprA [Acidimicrobiales bacterium]|nr:DNA-processing protein DprA [Acidimicrobiales bacterium]
MSDGPIEGDVAERAFLAALAGLPSMGPARLRALLDLLGPAGSWKAVSSGRLPREVQAVIGPRAASVATSWVEVARTCTPEAVLAELHSAGVTVARRGEHGYPPALVDDPDPPEVLFSVGRPVVSENGPTVAIVGTRRCTRYGTEVAVEFGRGLSEAGVVVVSGLASGIDTAGHAGVLAAGGGSPPVAVVATGLDIVYPVQNRTLWRRIADAGQIISEFPLGVGPARWRFPARNRIIAALADVLVVVESHLEGGSMHTVTAALERDRPVLVVPGPIRSPASEGANRLLSDGAAPACSVDDILCALNLVCPEPVSPVADHGAPPVVVDPADLGVLEALGWEPTTLDGLATRTRLSPVQLGSVVGRLQRAGLISEERGFLQRCSGSGAP